MYLKNDLSGSALNLEENTREFKFQGKKNE